MSAEVPEAASEEVQKEMEDKVISPENAKEAKVKSKQRPTATPDKTEVTGDYIPPTPQDLPQWKPSLVASKLAGWLIKKS
uniref:Uncharacterized protein n=1 Tax=Moschus moschiferus TaxID=68415 RepID=A0A8C6EA93_MOSMO